MGQAGADFGGLLKTMREGRRVSRSWNHLHTVRNLIAWIHDDAIAGGEPVQHFRLEAAAPSNLDELERRRVVHERAGERAALLKNRSMQDSCVR